MAYTPKKLILLSIFEMVKNEVTIIENKEREYSADILRKYFIYMVAMKVGGDSDELVVKESGMAL